MINSRTLCLACCVLLASCHSAEPVDENAAIQKYVSGSITYYNRMALTDQAVVEVSLRDVSLADAPATIISEVRMEDPGQVPIKFKLPYSSDDIDVRHVYAIHARISDRGQLQFVSDTHTPVLTRGEGDQVKMTLVKVDHQKSDQPVTKTSSAGFDIEGMFRYMADAAVFRDCRDNRVYPVAMEGQYLDLEEAYTGSDVEPGEEAHIFVTGRYLERPSMEDNINKVSLIVDTFKQLSDESECTPEHHADLQDTYWRLLEIDGKKVNLPAGVREPHIILSRAETRAQGFAGCNSFFGGYELDRMSLSFSRLGHTMMACASGMDLEQSFLKMLGETTRAQVSGQVLHLYAEDRLLARLESVYF